MTSEYDVKSGLTGRHWNIETFLDTHLELYFLVRLRKWDCLLKNIASSVKSNGPSPVVKGAGNKNLIPIIRPVIPKHVQSVTEWSSIFAIQMGNKKQYLVDQGTVADPNTPYHGPWQQCSSRIGRK